MKMAIAVIEKPPGPSQSFLTKNSTIYRPGFPPTSVISTTIDYTEKVSTSMRRKYNDTTDENLRYLLPLLWSEPNKSYSIRKSHRSTMSILWEVSDNPQRNRSSIGRYAKGSIPPKEGDRMQKKHLKFTERELQAINWALQNHSNRCDCWDHQTHAAINRVLQKLRERKIKQPSLLLGSFFTPSLSL